MATDTEIVLATILLRPKAKISILKIPKSIRVFSIPIATNLMLLNLFQSFNIN